MLLIALALAEDEAPTVTPFRTPTPVPDIEAAVLLEANPGVRYTCPVTALIDVYGEVLDAAPDDSCRKELRNTARDGLRAWQFHPPQVEDRAVKGSFDVEFVFVAGTVLSELPIEEDQVLIRLKPTAVPLWPTPPRASGKARREGLVGRCVLDLEVDDRGMPHNVRNIDCPLVLEDRVVQRLSRFGIETVGARPGDGRTYRIDILVD